MKNNFVYQVMHVDYWESFYMTHEELIAENEEVCVDTESDDELTERINKERKIIR